MVAAIPLVTLDNIEWGNGPPIIRIGGALHRHRRQHWNNNILVLLFVIINRYVFVEVTYLIVPNREAPKSRFRVKCNYFNISISNINLLQSIGCFSYSDSYNEKCLYKSAPCFPEIVLNV